MLGRIIIPGKIAGRKNSDGVAVRGLMNGCRERFLRMSGGHSKVAVSWIWEGFTGPDIYGQNMQRVFFRIAKENFPDRLKLFLSEHV